MTKERPPIVCLCGSTKFKDSYRKANKFFTLKGYIVLSVGSFGHTDGWDNISKQDKINLDELHKRKIDLADFIFIINEDGYVGDSTISEIGYAQNNDTPIVFMFADGKRIRQLINSGGN